MVKYILKRKPIWHTEQARSYVYLEVEERGHWHFSNKLEDATQFADHNDVLKFVANGGLDETLGGDHLTIVKVVAEEVCTMVLKEIA